MFASEVLFKELVLENIKMNLRKFNQILNYDIARGKAEERQGRIYHQIYSTKRIENPLSNRLKILGFNSNFRKDLVDRFSSD